jgi:Cu+-exporting ATPase
MGNCYHCGDVLPTPSILLDQKEFCCQGCANVYSLLNSNSLKDFYQFEKTPGTKPNKGRIDKFQFLDIPEIRARFVQYEDEKITRVKLSLPSIHCSSCIYLLENLTKINEHVLTSQVHFAKKEATIVFDRNCMKLSEIADLLQFIGYEPDFGRKTEIKGVQKSFLLKIGLAGFAFGSIMLWSAPDYVGITLDNLSFRNFTAYLSFIVSLPVFLYSASEYYVSAYKAIRSKSINLDVPITMGILALYAKSTYQIFNQQGPGYMDSFAGFIFFLLIGKWFQNRTYQSLSFDRDYSSYFPVAIHRFTTYGTEIIPIEQLKQGDHIQIRNEEIIPCDSYLISEEAQIDFSFVTGESALVTKKKGDLIYAGGKLIGLSIELAVKSETNRSHLTQLWNETKNKKESNKLVRYQDRISRYFLIILIIVALLSGIAWAFIDPTKIMTVIVSILIVACPCALALSSPFTLGNTLSVLGKNGLYLKNTTVVEALSEITTIVFDKTGTLTDPMSHKVHFSDVQMSDELWNILKALSSHSTHPLSQLIHKQLTDKNQKIKLNHFIEHKGKGIEARFNGHHYQLGSSTFVGNEVPIIENGTVFFTQDGEIQQKIHVQSAFRASITSVLNQLTDKKIFVLSGDDSTDLPELIALGFKSDHCFFKQEPKDKADFIASRQKLGEKVLMLGDGLNDVGAMGTANVGIALSEDMFRFTPSSDAILDAKHFHLLASFFHVSSYAKIVLQICLGFSITYNLIGLSFAISATLAPIVAAILMPVSSITVVFLSSSLIHFKFWRGIE